MRVKILQICITACLLAFSILASAQKNKWVSLFDGKTFNGWTINENQSSFKIEKGAIVVNGPVGHLFYTGKHVEKEMKDFEVKAKIMTFPGANSGFYINTRYQETGFPGYGYEVQVNNSHTDVIRTGSLYNVVNVLDKYATDGKWFELYIKVADNRVMVKVDGVQVVNYDRTDKQGEDLTSPERFSGMGTIAIQAHDPQSKVMYKNIKLRRLD